jgi:hypothetical protein
MHLLSGSGDKGRSLNAVLHNNGSSACADWDSIPKQGAGQYLSAQKDLIFVTAI